jgi:tRNA pseudouridine38-40 synthase
LLIEYDGGRYQGWQRQGSAQTDSGVKTIAGALDRVLHRGGVKILNLTGAGRTDAGVHALGQVAHLHVAKPIAPSDLYDILERDLPSDIAILQLEASPPDFDARRDAISRTYLYKIAQRKSAFAKNYTWWPKLPIDQALLERAWKLFEGNHSMLSFADTEANENTRCQIYSCQMGCEGSILTLRVTGRFFLRRQVRRMVGAVVHCAIGKARIDQIKKSLQTPSSSAALFWSEKSAPAAGLFLETVGYPER